MQLNITTDYAVRIMLYLSMSEGENLITSSELAEQLVVPRSFLYKIGNKLSDAGLILVKPGVNGGYRLARPAETITLFDVIRVMEQSSYISRCLEKDAYCSRCAADHCPVRRFYQGLQGKIEDLFSSITLAELASDRDHKEWISSTCSSSKDDIG